MDKERKKKNNHQPITIEVCNWDDDVANAHWIELLNNAGTELTHPFAPLRTSLAYPLISRHVIIRVVSSTCKEYIASLPNLQWGSPQRSIARLNYLLPFFSKPWVNRGRDAGEESSSLLPWLTSREVPLLFLFFSKFQKNFV